MFDVNYDFFLIENNFKEIEGVKSEKIQEIYHLNCH